MLLKHCCYCLSLRTGAFIIASLGFVVVVIEFLTLIDIHGDPMHIWLVGDIPQIYSTSTGKIPLLSILTIFTTSLLILIGAVQRKARLIRVAFFMDVGIIICEIIFAINKVVFAINHSPIATAMTMISLIILGTVILIKFYVWIAMYSFYQELEKTELAREMVGDGVVHYVILPPTAKNNDEV